MISECTDCGDIATEPRPGELVPTLCNDCYLDCVDAAQRLANEGEDGGHVEFISFDDVQIDEDGNIYAQHEDDE